MDDPKEILKNIFMERDGQIFLNVEFAIRFKNSTNLQLFFIYFVGNDISIM